MFERRLYDPPNVIRSSEIPFKPVDPPMTKR